MAENRQYDHEYKVQAVKLAKEIGQAKAAKELRLVHHGHLLLFEGKSYRMEHALMRRDA